MPPIKNGITEKCSPTARAAALEVSKLAADQPVTVVVLQNESINKEVRLNFM